MIVGDTIFALSSGHPPAGIAIVRVSGPAALATLEAVAGVVPPARRATMRALTDPASGTLLDRALVIAFPGPGSATGEDVVEFHLHGGKAVIAGVLDMLGARPGLRLAEPGEFTRRAFTNGRLDLASAEGLADLVAASTTAQRDLALAHAGGLLAKCAQAWRKTLVTLLAEAEAALDFGEEAELFLDDGGRIPALLAELRVEIADTIVDAQRGMRLRDGLRIVVVGPPNAGKSSLVNALARRDAAIVTPFEGTTRDLIEVPLDLDGVAAVLIDTAGLRDTDDPIEVEGIRRARSSAASADLALHVDTAMPAIPLGQIVINKIDLTNVAPGLVAGCLHVSAVTGSGLSDLRRWLGDWAIATMRPAEPPVVSRRRQLQALQAASSDLATADAEADLVLYAEAVRLAARALDQLVGRIAVDDMLNDVFSRFCVGK